MAGVVRYILLVKRAEDKRALNNLTSSHVGRAAPLRLPRALL
jgi:hypothetical protein